MQLIASNARAIEANAAAISDLRADHADVLEGLRLQMQLLREEQDRRAEMQQEMVRNERRYLELKENENRIREDIQMMQSEIRGLQIQANRILDRLEGGS